MVRRYEEYQEFLGIARKYAEFRGEMKKCQEMDEPRLNSLGPVQRRQALLDQIKRSRQEIREGIVECDKIRRDTRR